MAEDRMLSDEILLGLIKANSGGGGGGTSNYNDLSNKPQIGGVTLSGNKSASDLGLVAAVDGKGLSTNDYTDADKAIVGGVTAALAGKQNALTAGDYIEIDDDTISVNRWALPAGDVIYTVITGSGDYGREIHVQRHTVGGTLIDDREYHIDTWGSQDVDDKIRLAQGYAQWNISLLADSKEHSSGYSYNVNPNTTETSNSFTFTLTQEENANDLIIRSELDAALATKADLTDLAPAFSSSTAYTVGQYVSYDGNIYKCTSAHSAGAWVAGDFTLVAVGSELEIKQNATDNSLDTEDKTIVGAINEHEGDIDSLKSGLTNVADDVKLNTQDLTTPSRTKNLLPMILSDIKSANNAGTWSGNAYTVNDVTFTVQTDGDGNITGIIANGTASHSTYFYVGIINTNAGIAYTLTGCPSGGSNNSYYLGHIGTSNDRRDFGSGKDFPVDGTDSTYQISIFVANGYVVDSLSFAPMIRLTADTSITFAPYIPSVESRIEAVESGKAGYVDLGTITGASANDAIENAFDALTVYDKTVIGNFTNRGGWMFMAYKYTGGGYGNMVAFRFDGMKICLSVIDNVKTVQSLAVVS